MNKIMLAPALALVVWTLCMWVLLYATRLPAIFKAKVDFNKVRTANQLRAALPEKTSWISDNYNHLHEQPVIFYTLCFILALVTEHNELNAVLAWVYVALRVTHSLWQSFVNIIPVRFAIFVLASSVLFALAFRAALVFYINL